MSTGFSTRSARLVVLSLAVAAIASIPGVTAQAETFTQWVPVVSATPIYVRVSEPQQQCWSERVTTSEYVDRNGVPLADVASGITGGVVNGNEQGTAREGRDISASTLAEMVDRPRAGITVGPVTRDVERCRSVDSGRDVLDGYDVTYRYQNRNFTTRLPYLPGDRIQVQIAVEPQPR